MPLETIYARDMFFGRTERPRRKAGRPRTPVRQPDDCCPRKRHVWGTRQSRWLLTWPAALLSLDCPTSHKTDNPRIGFGLYLVAAVSRRFQAVCTASAHLGHIIKFNFGDRAGPRDPPSSAASSRPDWAPAISQRPGLFLFRPGAAIAIPANCSTCSAVIARRHGLHSNVCISGKPPIDGTVREKCIASPQLGQIAN